MMFGGGFKGKGRKGLLDRMEQSSPPPGLSQVESYMYNGVEQMKADSIVYALSDTEALARTFKQQGRTPTAEQLVERFSRWAKDKWAIVLGQYCYAAIEEGVQDAHSAMLVCGRALNQLIEDLNRESSTGWITPLLSVILPKMREVALQCERNENTKGKRMDEVASVFQTCLTRLAADRSTSLAESGRLGMVTVCNNLSKAAFYTNNMGVLKPALQLLQREIEKGQKDQVNLLDLVTEGQRVAFLYYAGRVAMLDQRFAEAQKALDEAFLLCPSAYTQNKLRILVFLVTANLVQGKYPKEELLKKYQLDTLFLPLINGCKEGKVTLFDNTMDQNASFFAKLGIYVMLHKARSVCFLNLVRRTHLALSLMKPGDDTFRTRIKISQLLAAYKAANDGNTIDPEEMECALVYLVANAHIKGYISRQHRTIVLDKRNNPFPGCPPL